MLFAVDMNRTKCFLAALLFWCIPAFIGCSTHQERADRLAKDAGFSKTSISGAQFWHVVYLHEPDEKPTDELHIYIEGDGTPWIGGRYPAIDPTPTHPMALEMMAQDPAPAIYLGRPCYFGLAQSTHCRAEFWTSKRYSPEVVESMLSVIKHYQQAYQSKSIVLIGYSGGGTLAALLARRLQPPVFLLTIAANLDTNLWTGLRGFLPLEGSLNPIDYRLEIAQIPQLHLVGLQDHTVPISVTESYTAGLDTQYVRRYPEFDHFCCWVQLWPEILAEKPWANSGEEPITAQVP